MTTIQAHSQLTIDLVPRARNADLPGIKQLLPRGWYIEYHDVDGEQDEFIRLGKYGVPLSGGGCVQFTGVAGMRRLAEMLFACGGSDERLLNAALEILHA